MKTELYGWSVWLKVVAQSSQQEPIKETTSRKVVRDVINSLVRAHL